MDRTSLGRIGSVAAGVAGGAVIGALLFAPLSSLAQDDGTESPEPEATQEDGTDDRPFGDGRGPGGHMRGGHGVMLGEGLEVAAEALGVTESELMSALEDGRSVADVAEEQGVDVQDVVDALVAAATDRLDEAVEDGRIDADRAEEIEAELPDRIAAMVEREGLPGRLGRGGGFGPGGGMGPGECHEDGDGTDSDGSQDTDGSSTESPSSTSGGSATTAGVQWAGTVLMTV